MNALSQDARALIDSVSRLDDPSVADKARIRQRLGVQLGGAAFATLALTGSAGGGAEVVELAATSASKASVQSGIGKLLALGGVAGALASAWFLGGEAPSAARRSAQPAPVASAEASAVGPASVAAQRAVPALDTASALLRSRAEPRASSVTAEVAPSAEPVAPVRKATATATPARSDLRSRASTAATSVADDTSTLGAELTLLSKAQAALRAGQSEQALKLAEEHRARFPQGILKEERTFVAALAQCTAGRSAPAEAQSLLKLAPGSPLAARVRKACGLE